MPNATGPGSFELSQLARDLYRMGPEIRKQLRTRLTQIGQPLLADARSRAGWSSRIPGAISVRPVMSDARSYVGIELRVNVGPNAPHARAYEGGGQAGEFRHPVFAKSRVKGRKEWTWVTSATRPYAWPAVWSHRDDAARAAEAAIDAAARAASFR